MEQMTAPRDKVKGREEGQPGTENARVYLENGTLMLIKDDRVALRRLDLESCCVMQIPSAPEFKLYYRTGSGDAQGGEGVHKHLGVQIVAISKKLNKEEGNGDLSLISNALREKLCRWNKELELRTEITFQQECIGAGRKRAGVRLPTLLDLLSVLCSDRITTGEQRKLIRDAINLFLMGEVRYEDVFLIFAQILGDEVLHHLIASLEGPLEGNGSLDFSWMIRSFDFNKGISPLEGLFSHADTQTFLRDSVRLYPLGGIDPRDISNVGYSSVRCGPYLVFLGGVKTSKREQGLRSVVLHPFDRICVLNTESLHVSSFDCLGPTPRPTIHHSSDLLVSPSGPKILLSGGLCWDESAREFSFSGSTCLFNMSSRSWTVLSECANTPRFLHSSLTYPQYSPTRPSQFVIVFGGLTKSLKEISPSNDLWVFSTKFNSWTQVAVLPAPNSTQTELPMPRFGHSMAWVNEKTFVVYGGESRTSDGKGGFLGVLLDDIWSFTINSSSNDIENLNIRGHWTKISTSGSPRPLSTLHACIALSFPKSGSRSEQVSDLNLSVSGDSNNSHQLLFVGGCTSPLVKSYPIHLNDQELASEDHEHHHQDWFLFNMEDSRFELDSKDATQVSLLDIHSNEWTSIRNLRVSNPSPTAKSILTPQDELDDFSKITILGGTCCIFETDSVNKSTAIPCVLLQMLDQKSRRGEARRARFAALSLLGLEPYRSSTRSDGACSDLEPGRTSCSVSGESVIPDSVSRYLKPKPSRSFSILASVFSSLRSSQSWVFGAIAHLVDNSFSPEVNSSLLEISICRSYISVIDNGSGLHYNDLSRLFRCFGADSSALSAGYSPSCDDARQSSSLRMYGLGFKHAFSRLSETCMVFTKAGNTIGVGLVSKAIMESENLLENRYWTPICYWYSDTMKPLVPQGSSILEHEENQRLILQYGFIKDPSLLCDHFDTIDSPSGTKMLFGLDEKCIKLHPAQYVEVSGAGLNLLSQQGSLVDSSSSGPCVFSLPREDGSPRSPESASLYWSSERSSIDYSLSTYLSWLYLNKTQRIFCQGKLLSYGDKSESSTLYECLAKSLRHSVELSRIYKDGSNDGAFALIGKLSQSQKTPNEQGSVMASESETRGSGAGCPENGSLCDTSASRPEQTLEAGILLYYNGRLIKRLDHAFPNTKPKETSEFQVTALVNVPQWLKPSSNKQEFVLERTGIFEEFQSHVNKVISEYIALHLDQEKLRQWEAQFNKPSSEDSSLLRPNKIPKLEE